MSHLGHQIFKSSNHQISIFIAKNLLHYCRNKVKATEKIQKLHTQSMGAINTGYKEYCYGDMIKQAKT